MAQAVGEGGFFTGAFGKMKFPKYKYQEYPKRITAPDGTRIRVMDPSDELRVKATLPAARPQTEVERERDSVVAERDGLATALDDKQREAADLRQKLAKMEADMAALKAAPVLEAQAKIVPPVVVAPAAKK